MLTIDEIKEIEFGLVRSLQGGRIEWYNSDNISWGPFEHGTVGLYDGDMWVPVTPEGLVFRNNTDYDIHGASVSGSQNYDVYARYQSQSTFNMELVPWEHNNARATEPSRFEGVLVYENTTTSGKQMRFLGSVRTNSSGEFVSSNLQRFIVNWDHPILKTVQAYPTVKQDNDSGYKADWAELPASMQRGEFLHIHSGVGFTGSVQVRCNQDGRGGAAAIGLNSTSSKHGCVALHHSGSDNRKSTHSFTYVSPPVGYSYFTIVWRAYYYGTPDYVDIYSDSSSCRAVISVYT